MSTLLPLAPTRKGYPGSFLVREGDVVRSGSARLELRDHAGRLVRRAYGSTSGTELGLGGLPAGVYLAIGSDRSTLSVLVAGGVGVGLSVQRSKEAVA